MKRSEALKLVVQKLKDLEFTHKIYFAPDEDHADQIIKLLENLDIIDRCQYGSQCSRCDRRSWDIE